MKKFFTLLAAALFVSQATKATDVTFAYPTIYASVTSNNSKDVNGDANTIDGVTITFNKGTNSNTPKYYANGTSIRSYGGNTITVASSGNNISKISIHRANAADNALKADQGTFTDEGTGSTNKYSYVDWTGDASSVTFTVGSTKGQCRIDTIIVTLSDAAAAVKAPTFTPEAGNYTSAVDVTIDCETSGATIYYTTDGTAPTTSSTVYSSAINIAETTTLKAIAVKGSETSSISSATYTILTSVATIAEAQALEQGTKFYFSGEVQVAYQNGSNLWIKDDTGYMLIYGSVGQTYNQGDIIPAGWNATLSAYYGVTQFASPSDFAASTENKDLESKSYSASEVTADNVHEYLTVTNCTVDESFKNIIFTNSEGAQDTLLMYNKFKVETPTYSADSTYNIEGVITIYKNAAEVYPIKITTTTGINGVIDDNASVESVKFYNINGTATEDAMKGVTIRVATLSNGKKVAKKVIK